MNQNGKDKIAFDVDGIFAKYFERFLEYYNNRFGTNFSIEELTTLHIWEVLGLKKGEEVPIINDFSNTEHFSRISPYDGSREAVQTLSRKYSLGIITARSKDWRAETIRWLEGFYGNFFHDGNVHFTSQHFSGNGGSERKSEICIQNGYVLLVDDYPGHVNDCAENGIRAFLMERPWNKGHYVDSSVTKIKNFEELVGILT